MTVTSLDQAHACSGKGVGVVDMKWRAGVKPLVILTGNSFAGQWYGELRRILPSNVTVMPLTITSCRPWSFGGSQLDSHGNSCSAHAKFVLDTIRRERPGLTVVSYQRTELDKSQIPGTRKLLRGFRKAGGRVLFLGPAPVLKDFSVCLSTGRSATNCNRYLKPSDWKVEARTANAVHSAGATYLSVQRLVCTKTVCPAFIAGKPARRDGTHLSRWVPRGIAGFVVDAIRRSIRPHRQF